MVMKARVKITNEQLLLLNAKEREGGAAESQNILACSFSTFSRHNYFLNPLDLNSITESQVKL